MESTKTVVIERRLKTDFYKKYCTGQGIDIGTSSGIPKNVWWLPLDLTCDPYEQEGSPHAKSKFAKPHLVGDATYLAGVKDESYDWVYSSHCLEHIQDDKTAVTNWMRVLKPGGYLLISVP